LSLTVAETLKASVATPQVKYFRARRHGLECGIEDVLVSQCSAQKFGIPIDKSTFIAGSPQIGAGMPDLVFVTCEPNVFAISNLDMPTARVLAYLRAVGRAKLDTIADRTGGSPTSVRHRLDSLVDAQAISAESGLYALAHPWRNILPEIVTIEAKVRNWQKAVDQASRNRIFSHRSFVALPEDIAERVKNEERIVTNGVGLLSITKDSHVDILRKPRRQSPRVWTYYYQLALLVATNFEEMQSAIYDNSSRCSSTLPGIHVHKFVNAE